MEPHNSDPSDFGGGSGSDTPPLAPLAESRTVNPSASPAQTNLGQRLGSTEAELARLSGNLRKMRMEWEQSQADNLRERYDTLRQAVLRYSIACAEVDVCVALMHARTDPTGESAENLRRSLEEQATASNELRILARSLHENPRKR